MINFSSRLSNPFSSALFCLLAIIVLQGCGAERTTPYNPDIPSSACSSSSSSSSSSSLEITDSSSSSSRSSSSCSSSSSSSSSSSTSSSSSSFSSVNVVLIVTAANTASSLAEKQKIVKVARSEAEYDALSMTYVGNTMSAQDFALGQVVLIDDGEINNCVAHLSFNSKISAQELSENTVKVLLGYNEKPAQTSCLPTTSRPFYFYYIATRKLLVFEEKIE